MKMVDQSFIVEDLGATDGWEILKKLEKIGRTCYKSEHRIDGSSAEKFVRGLIQSGHHSVIEHHHVTARIVTNRGVTHEIVRHRLASYSQESTRYCDYNGDDVIFVRPVWLPYLDGSELEEKKEDHRDYWSFIESLKQAEWFYKDLREKGWSPQQAREVLPNALKTELVMTANLREWRHFFTLRCSKAAHPQMRSLALTGLRTMRSAIPIVFEDVWEELVFPKIAYKNAG